MKSHIHTALLTFVFSIVLLQAQNSSSGAAYVSVKDGMWNQPTVWKLSGNEANLISCNPSGSSSFTINDSVSASCDKLTLSGDASITIESGGELEIKGSLELIGKAVIQVKKGGKLFVGKKLLVSGNAKLVLDGELISYGLIDVSGNAFACGKGSVKAGSSVSGNGWCLDLSVLPIEILSIDAQLITGESIMLQWTSKIASVSDFFTIERSANGMSFTSIGKVNNSNTQGIYTFKEDILPTGTYYYRITQKDQHGQTEAQEILATTIDTDEITGKCELLVDPNPCRPSCLITLEDCPGAVFKTYVVDGAGRMISELVPINTTRTDLKVQYYLNKDNFMVPGVYIIRAQSESVDISKKLIIK